jgi:ribose/xylose/arabinose/galactoside ABC-type transport system permease subunit
VISGVNSIRPGYGSEYLLISVLIAILNFSPFFKKFMWGLLLVGLMVFHHFRRRFSQRHAARRSLGPREPAVGGQPA